MKIRISEFLLTLVIFSASFPLFSESASAPFAKLIESTGPVKQTILDVVGGFVSISVPDENRLLVRKVRRSGDAVWETSLNLPPFASIDAIAQTKDYGYSLVGQSANVSDSGNVSGSNGIVVKLYPNGKVQWKRTFSIDGGDVWFEKVVSMLDGGFIVSGGVNLVPHLNLFLARFNPSGEIQWSKGFNIPADAVSLLRTANNKIVVTTSSSKVIKFDSLGRIISAKAFNAPGFQVEAVNNTIHNGVILAGVSQPKRGENFNQIVLIGLQSDNKVAWTAKFDFLTHRPSISDVVQTIDKGFALTGLLVEGEGPARKVNSFLMKIDSSRNVVFQRNFGTGVAGDSGSLFVFGNAEYFIFSSNGDGDTLISKLDVSGTIPSCGLFFSVPFSNIPFGELKGSPFKNRSGEDLSLIITDININSESSQHSLSTVCQ